MAATDETPTPAAPRKAAAAKKKAAQAAKGAKK